MTGTQGHESAVNITLAELRDSSGNEAIWCEHALSLECLLPACSCEPRLDNATTWMQPKLGNHPGGTSDTAWSG